MKWYHKYLGLEWVAYATGPDSFDCWGLVFHVLKDHYGVVGVERFADVITNDLRAIDRVATSEALADEWTELENPREGSVVLMATGRLFHHIGIFTNGGVLHTRDRANVCKESIDQLKRSGFKKFKFYEHKSIFSSIKDPV